MKTLPVLFVASLLILASLQADAKRLNVEGKHNLLAERQLLSDRKANVGTNNDAKDTTETKTGRDSNNDDDDDDDDTNQSYGKYGNSNGSTAKSHHYFTNDQKPIKN